jgi:hypothetical protein
MLMRTPRPERQSEPDAEHLDNMLDEALRETFPASDPIAITIDKPLKSIASEEHQGPDNLEKSTRARTISQRRHGRRLSEQNPSWRP